MFTRVVVVVVAVVVVVVGRSAAADPLADVRARISRCTPDAEYARTQVDAIGGITKVEPIGLRPLTEAAQLFGSKGRAYAMFHADNSCTVLPVVGKAAAATKGNFGGGATVAYLVQSSTCSKESCPTVVSVKTSADVLVDAIEVEPCVSGAELAHVGLRSDRDSLQLECWNSGGADRDLTESLIDLDHGRLGVAIEAGIGIAWIQVIEGHEPYCVARPPGGITIGTRGDLPEIEVTQQARTDEASSDDFHRSGIEWRSAGCEQTFKTQHHKYDPKTHRFVAVGKPRFGIATKLCHCPKQK